MDGYIRCLKERQRRELAILEQIPIERLVLDNPQHNWQQAKTKIRAYLADLK